MGRLVKTIFFVFATLELTFARGLLEHATIISGIPTTTSIANGDVKHFYIIDGDPLEIYHKHITNQIFTNEHFSSANVYSMVVSCDVDFRRKKFYFYDAVNAAIIGITNFDWETDFAHKKAGVLHAGVSGSVHGKLAVDYVSDNVYWADPVFRWIAVMPGVLENVDQSNFKVLVHKDLMKPTAMAVSPKHGYIFWSDLGTVVKIERSNMIGEERTAIVSTGLIEPIAIDVDLVGNAIYWVDVQRDTVESADLDGNNRRTVRRRSHSDMVDLVVHGDVLAATDYKYGVANFFNKTSGEVLVPGLKPTNDDKVWAICLYTQEAQPDITDNCPTKNCEHICVNQPGGATCLCKEGYQLNADGNTCTEVEGDMHRALVVAGSNGICARDIRSLAYAFQNRTTCYSAAESAEYLDIDMINRVIYFVHDGAVHKLLMDTNTVIPSIVSPTYTITGLALDWRDGNLYFTAVDGTGAGKIELFSQTTSSTYTILEGNLNNPRDLVLLPLDDLMLWISGSTGSFKIESAAMSGTDRGMVIDSDDLVNPTSLSVDPVSHMIYWTDIGIIRRSLMDGTEIANLAIKYVTSAQLIHIYKNHVIFTDQISGTTTHVKAEDLNHAQIVESEFVIPEVGAVTAIKTLDAHTQPSQKGPCDHANGDCEHICLPVGSTKICKCEYGFTLDDNRESCSSTLVEDNFILVSDWTHDKIYQYDFATKVVHGLDTTYISNPIGIAFNHVTKHVIWGDSGQLVHRVGLDGTGHIILADLEMYYCHADRFAIDYSTGNLYYTAVRTDFFGFAGVGVISPKGDHLKLIRDGESARDIVLDPKKGILFWTDIKADACFVKRANMDGSSVTPILSNNQIGWPNGLAIDPDETALYLSDGELNTIRKCTYSGSCNPSLHSPSNAHLMDIILLGQYLYYTAWNRQYLTRVNKYDGSDVTRFAEVSELGRLDSLAIYDSAKTPAPVPTACTVNNGGCSTFCLPMPDGGHTCKCEDYVNLQPDGRTCENATPRPDTTTTTTVTTPTPTKPKPTTPPRTKPPPTTPPPTPPTTPPPTTPPPTTPSTSTTNPPPSGSTEKQTNDDGIPIPVVAGAAAGALVFIGIVVIVTIVCCKRCSDSKRHSPFDPYLEPISDLDEGAGGGAGAAGPPEYDYIGLDNIQNAEKEKEKERMKEDDARKSVNVYSVQSPAYNQRRQHPMGIEHLSVTQPGHPFTNDYEQFGDRHGGPRANNHNYNYSPNYFRPSSLPNSPPEPEPAMNINNQFYNLQGGHQNEGFSSTEDQTTPKMPRRHGDGGAPPQQPDTNSRNRNWASPWDGSDAGETNEYMTPQPSDHGSVGGRYN